MAIGINVVIYEIETGDVFMNIINGDQIAEQLPEGCAFMTTTHQIQNIKSVYVDTSVSPVKLKDRPNYNSEF